MNNEYKTEIKNMKMSQVFVVAAGGGGGGW